MVDMFNQERMCDKHFKEGEFVPAQITRPIEKDSEEVVHVDDELPTEETNVISEEDETNECNTDLSAD